MFTDYIFSISRYAIPFLSVVILLRNLRSLLRGRTEPEIWAYLRVGQENVPVYHWESLIGRARSADIRLFGEGISPIHAVLKRTDKGRWSIYDVFSRSGVWVNSVPVPEAGIPLRHGDLINLGGSSLYALGVNKEQTAWRIGIRHPRKEDAQEKMAVLPLKDAALSTSGDYERFFEAGGVRYHHIIDPRTGRPAQSGAISVTIVADSSVPDGGMLTDLLTTAIFVLGPEQGIHFLQAMPHGIKGAIVDGRYQLWTTGDMAKELEDVSQDFQFWQGSGELQ